MRTVVHVLGPSQGGIRRHVRYIASHPPDGWTTAAVRGPEALRPYFTGLPFTSGAAPPADLVHAHGLTAGRYALRPRRPAVVLSVHTSREQTLRRGRAQALLWIAARVIAARADAVVAVSRDAARSFPGARVVPPAVELPPPPSRPREEVRAALGACRDDVVVLSVARLHRDKRLDLVIEAVRGTGAVCWIAGDGPARSGLASRASGTSVRFLGQRDDVPELLAAADLFALPSAGEAYGIAVLEAIASGLPVVATRVGAIPEIVGGGGLLVAPDDDRGFVDAVRRSVADPGLRASLRDARPDPPDPAALVAALGAIYDEVTA